MSDKLIECDDCGWESYLDCNFRTVEICDVKFNLCTNCVDKLIEELKNL